MIFNGAFTTIVKSTSLLLPRNIADLYKLIAPMAEQFAYILPMYPAQMLDKKAAIERCGAKYILDHILATYPDLVYWQSLGSGRKKVIHSHALDNALAKWRLDCKRSELQIVEIGSREPAQAYR